MSATPRIAGSRYAVVLLTAVVGTLATIGVFLLVSFWERRVAAIEFESRAKSYLEFMNADLGDASTLMYNLAAFIGSSDHPVTASEFAEFSASAHRRASGLRDTGWAPLVTRAERPAFERAARAAGNPTFAIEEFGPNHALVRARPRAEYYPLLYIEAGGAKRPLLGLDLNGDARRAAALRRALAGGRPAATPPIDVVTVKQRGAGVLSYMPAYFHDRGEGSGGRRALGIVFGVFDIPATVGNIVARHQALNDLSLYLFNPAARSERRLIYRTPAVIGSGAPRSERDLLAGEHLQGTVVLFDQQLGAIVTPARPVRFGRWTFLPAATLIVGLAITAMSVIYLLILLRRTRQLENLTTNLRTTTEHIREISRHDPLTGMPNRLLFGERLDQALAAFKSEAPFALLLLDLDRFKAVNDTLGHRAGDRVLCGGAERILRCVRDVDTAARLGGDEFAILLGGPVDNAIIAAVANRLIAALDRPFTIDEHSVRIGVSIGAVIATHEASSESLLSAADLAMYAAKEDGRGTVRLFEPRLRERLDQKRSLEQDLRRGLERGELEVHYQPLINLVERRVAGFEALVRWRHPERGLIPPDQFIAVAEECGLIGQLGLWVMRTACEDAARWPQPLKVAVNISPFQLTDAALLEKILDCLNSSGLPPGRLEIELTEAAVLHQSEMTLALLTRLRTVGIAVALDDFGTGYSSLSSLLRFPFDKLKIDRSFLESVHTSPSAAAIVRAVVNLATNLNLTTTGEGVETRQQLAHLRSYGCTEAQGFLFSPARPNAEVPGLLERLNDSAIATLADTSGPTPSNLVTPNHPYGFAVAAVDEPARIG